MSWTGKLIKTLAIMAVPAKVISKGVDNVKQEFADEIKEYRTKVKILMGIGGAFMLFLLFGSTTLALVINHYGESKLLGFVIVSAIYLGLCTALFIIYRNDIIE